MNSPFSGLQKSALTSEMEITLDLATSLYEGVAGSGTSRALYSRHARNMHAKSPKKHYGEWDSVQEW